MPGDVSVGPDYFGRVLCHHFDEDNVEPGEVPRSIMEMVSVRFAEARARAMKRATKTHKPVSLEFTLVVTDLVAFGSGDAARVETSFAVLEKQTKEPKIKGKRNWLDRHGNQIGQEPAQTTMKAVDAPANDEAKAPKRKAL